MPERISKAYAGFISDQTTSNKSTSINSILKQNKIDNISYPEIRKGILENYSDPKLYTNLVTDSKNVFVYSDFYNDYKNSKLCKVQKEILDKEIKAGELFGQEGFQVYIYIYIARKCLHI